MSRSARLERTTPVFLVDDIVSTTEWYERTLGFKAGLWPDAPPYVFAIMTRDEVEIMLQRLPGYEKPSMYDKRDGGVWDVYIRTESVGELFKAVAEANSASVRRPLEHQAYGQIEFEVEDPNGYVLVFAEPTRAHTRQSPRR